MADAELLWDVSSPIAESPVYDDRSGKLWFRSQRVLAPGEGAQIYCFDERDGSRQVYEMPERVASLGLCDSGRLVVALDRRIAVFDPASGELVSLSEVFDEPAGNQYNDGKVGPDGCFWVGTSDVRRLDERTADGNGSLYRVRPDGAVEPKARGYLCSNGLAWSPDGKTMYQSDSFTGLIDAWDFVPGTGEIARQRRFATMTAAQGYPDGAACDDQGGYWSAGVTAGCFNHFVPTGELVERVEVPCPAPTMPCFAGDVLYFTSLQRRTSRDQFPIDPPKAALDVTGLFRMAAPARGAPIGRFEDR